jgi:hypothetical protein
VRNRERWKRYEKPEQGHEVQIDVNVIASLRGSRTKHYQFTAIDDCRRLRVLLINDQLSHKTAIQFVDYVLEKLPGRPSPSHQRGPAPPRRFIGSCWQPRDGLELLAPLRRTTR